MATWIRRVLSEEKCDVNAKDKNGRTALMLAAQNGHVLVVRSLSYKGNIHAETEYGETALMLAAQNGRLPVVRYLCNNNANVHAATKDGWTALMYAAQNGHLPVLQALWDKDFPSLKVLDIVLDLAKKNNRHEIVSYIEQKYRERGIIPPCVKVPQPSASI